MTRITKVIPGLKTRIPMMITGLATKITKEAKELQQTYFSAKKKRYQEKILLRYTDLYRKTDVDTFPLLEKFEQRMPRYFSQICSKKPGSIAREIEGGHLSKVPSWLVRSESLYCETFAL